MVSPPPLSQKKRPHSPDEASDDEIDVPPVSSKRVGFADSPLNQENHARNRKGPDLPSILLQPMVFSAPGPASPFSSVPGSAGYIDPTRFEISELSDLFSGSYSDEYMLQGLSSLSMIARDVAGSDIHPSFSREALSGTFTNPVYLLRGRPEMRRAQRQEHVDLPGQQDVDDIVVQHALIDEIDTFFEANGVSISPSGPGEENIEPFEPEDQEVQLPTTSSAASLAADRTNTLAGQQYAIQTEQGQPTSNYTSPVENKADESEDHAHAWSSDRSSMYYD